MMIAVLIDSRRKGASCRVNVRQATKLRASGLGPGDEVRVYAFNGKEAPWELWFIQDGVKDLPEGTTSVQAEHVYVGSGRVFVDLVR